MTNRPALVRTSIALGLQLLSGGAWAFVDPVFVSENAEWFVAAGLMICALAWLWDEIGLFLKWKRRGRRTRALEPAPPPRWGVKPDAFEDEFDYLALKEAGKAVRRDTHLGEALAFLAMGKWGHSYSEAFVAMFDGRAQSPVNRFHQLAHDGEITVWGKYLPNGVYERIPKEHWLKHHIDERSLIDEGVEQTRWADIHGSDGVTFSDLMVSRAEIEECRERGA